MALVLIFSSFLIIPAMTVTFWRWVFHAILFAAFVVTTFNMLWAMTFFWAVGRALGVVNDSWIETMWWTLRGGYIGLVD